ncbi:MAG: hypothetical protein N2234_08820, partial [Planctomycetota bacterium]|nr:hypothetical protein [Planctomycetota bacterium]
GKTAVSIRTATIAASAGRKPILFTMGRGGPETPMVLLPKKLTVNELIRLAESGIHSAGDMFESSIFSGMTVIGSRRAGGGLSASVFYTNLRKAVSEASKFESDLYIFEGSGTTEPPVEGASILLVPSFLPLSSFDDPFVRMRICRSICAVITAAEPPFASKEHIIQIRERLLEIQPQIKVCATLFRPKPAENIEKTKVVVATTAKEDAFNIIWRHLEETYGCTVVAMTGSLANKVKLRDDLTTLFSEKNVDVLLVELKAASIEVAARLAQAAEKRVVLMENIIEDLKNWDTNYESVLKQMISENLK